MLSYQEKYRMGDRRRRVPSPRQKEGEREEKHLSRNRAKGSPGQSFPPPAAAAATPRKGPALQGRWEVGRQDGGTPPAVGQT